MLLILKLKFVLLQYLGNNLNDQPVYRVIQQVSDLGWVDLDLVNSIHNPAWAAAGSYISSLSGELLKSKSTQPRSETC